MLVNCASIFFCFIFLFLIFFIMSSRRQNILFLISWGGALTLIALLLLVNRFIHFHPSRVLRWIDEFFSYLPTYPKEASLRRAFGIGFTFIGAFLLFFTLIEGIGNLFYPKEHYLIRKKQYYYGTKAIFIFVNLLFCALAMLFVITDLNIVYHIPESILSRLMALFESGLKRL